MQIAERLKEITPSVTLAINSRAQELRAQGQKVISLAVGEPDFPTPDFVKEGAKKAIDDNFTRYTPVPGVPALRADAGAYFGRFYGDPVPPESIIIGAGGKQCIYTYIQTTINPGDEVLIPAPYWVSYPDMVLLAGGKPVFVEAGVEAGFKVTPEALEKKRTAKTRLLILNSPNNPTGAVYSEEELAAILDWAIHAGLCILSDEIYDQLVFPPARMASAIKWFSRFPDQIVVANGLSKSFAMTGWRVGFLAAHPEIIRRMTALQGHSLSNVCSIAQAAARAALEGSWECVVRMRNAFQARRDLALDIIGRWKDVLCPAPEGAFYLFLDVSRLYGPNLGNSLQFAGMLLDKAHVAVVPGAAFGDDNCIRLSYAVHEDVLTEALEAMKKAMA